MAYRWWARHVWAPLLVLAACSGNVFWGGVLHAAPREAETGRWKLDGNGQCYFDENDSGPDQCSPTPGGPGRYKLDGSGNCVWVDNDSGPDQCTPRQANNDPPPSVECRSDIGTSRLSTAGYESADGSAVDVNVFTQSNSADVNQALQGAIDDWNAKTAQTGTRFHLTYSLNFPSVTVKGTGTDCGEYDDAAGEIRFDPSLLAGMAPQYVRHIMTHELGHFLGLRETGSRILPPSPPSVMNQTINLNGGSCHDSYGPGNPPTLTIQDNDVARVADCTTQARRGHYFSAQPVVRPFGRQQPSTMCDYYQVTDVYYCFDGCHYSNSIFTYLYTASC